MKSMLPICYVLTVLLYGLTFALHLLKRGRAETVAGIFALAANALALAVVVHSSDHAPVYHPFESYLTAVFVLAGLGLLFERGASSVPCVRTWVWVFVSLLLVFTLFSTKAPSPFQYDHGVLLIVLFHALRIISLSVMLFASACFFQFRLDRKNGLHGIARFHRGRNFLLLGTGIFLTAEYAGILWCKRGWGDFWMWNQGFFESTLMVLYCMLVFHIPGRGRLSEKIRSFMGSLSGIVLLALLAVRSLG